jgi:metal-responsive CopG/Arc/MetJ family transcriptional regulator
MKVAISLPDDLFEDAEYLARRQGKTRSRLYADAIAEYVGVYRTESVTDQLNAVYGDLDSSLDPALAQAQNRLLSDEDW